MSSRTLQNPVSRSLGLHLLLLLVAFFYVTHAPKFASITEPITVDFVDKVDEAQKKKAEDAAVKNSIVQKSAGEEAKVAKKDSFLSDKTRTTKEERSAVRPGQVDASGQIGSTRESAQPAQPIPQKAQPKSAAHPQAKDVKLSDLGVKVQMVPKDAPAYEDQRQWAPAQTGEAIRGGQFVQGMKEGEVSALNTKEFVFYSYFDRVRKQLDQAWQPLLREQIQRIYKTGRHLASNADYVTKTMVTLSAKGEILRVQVLEQSGTFDLDQVAVDALNKAGPYPNPPKGLIDGSGNVQIRWDFVLRT
jgi:TonB family protein